MRKGDVESEFEDEASDESFDEASNDVSAGARADHEPSAERTTPSLVIAPRSNAVDKTRVRVARKKKFVKRDVSSLTKDKLVDYLAQVRERLSGLTQLSNGRGVAVKWNRFYKEIEDECVARLDSFE